MTESGRRLARLKEIDVGELKAVSKKKQAGLAEMGIETVLDLLTHYPRRLVDRTRQAEIACLVEGEEAVVTASVVRASARRISKGRYLAEIVVADETGQLACTFFNQPWRTRQFRSGDVVTVFGKVDIYRGKRQMANPLVDLVGDQTGRIVAVYPQSGKAGITSVDLGRFVGEALERAGAFAEPIPRIAGRLGLAGRTEAFRAIHAPESEEDYQRARRRLVFDELLRLQVLLVRRHRAALAEMSGITHAAAGVLLDRFLSGLPFELTGAQKRAIEEIRADLTSPHPTNRLLQGDVGAGKTVVALAALLLGIEGGYQGAFMVPTEVLAEQHHLSAMRLLEGVSVPDDTVLGGARPLRVELLTNRTAGSDRARILAGLASGEIELVVGTHALIAEGVDFSRLGVVVVDEQHRFGVEQRAALREKATRDPDLLVMTATPIPRSAAMTVYGDLDHTTLDELPAGRSPIRTLWGRGERAEKAAWKRVREQVGLGHQAYVVCPLVRAGALADDGEMPEDPDVVSDDTDDLVFASPAEGPARPPRAATEERERLATGPLAGLRLGLLHGQLASREKEPVMSAFREGEIDVLVATTVIEVGVDVANATVMVIEDADRFGLAQLHQLRGRVGRSAAESWCFLLTEEDVTEQAERRLSAMAATQNGFELAEEDLDIRGGGTVFGARQKGRTDLKLANLRRDRELVRTAREVAEEILDEDPELSGPYALVWDEVEAFVSKDERAFLFRS